jgi:hypothetical protein
VAQATKKINHGIPGAAEPQRNEFPIFLAFILLCSLRSLRFMI